MCDTWPSRPLGENVFSSRQTTTFLIWSTTSLPSKSNHGFQNRLLGQQGVKSYVKLEARVITNCVSEAKCSLRAGGSQSRACAILAWGQEGRAPHHFPKHLVATQYQGQSWSRRKPGTICCVRLEPTLETCSDAAPPPPLLCQAKIHSGTVSSCSHDVLPALKFTAWLKFVL